jgi:Domain of unknown function (DUF4399)
MPYILYLHKKSHIHPMKPILSIPIAVFTLLVSCNNPSQNSQATSESNNSMSSVPKDSGVYFVNLKDGDSVYSPVIVQMGVKGKTVAPMGTMDIKTGHHHLIIDGSFIEKGQVVTKDSTHLHFGKGQTVDTLKIGPGKHTLTLQFADGTHMSYGKDWSSTISIYVKK